MIPLDRKYTALLSGPGTGPEAAVEGMRTCFEVLSLAAAIDRECAVRLGAHDLSEGRFVLLFLLQAAEGGLSPHELAEQAGVTRGTVTGLLDGLERSGFVRREENDIDRRKRTVRLTRDGAALVQRLAEEHGRWIGSLFADLSAAERDALRHLLGRVFARTETGMQTETADGGG
ncbi:transcriptional regulator, MarR family protein [Rhodospirillum centenum SW]|uniref:Transcriptional regulator, MarR family protein n=2 Tax=Rhodospirillum centenum TaxID=34018 RepID=B6IN43_RHOCS|nr:transcriptional regulator, MarR family protein [Rhodospirillum centenum SW]